MKKCMSGSLRPDGIIISIHWSVLRLILFAVLLVGEKPSFAENQRAFSKAFTIISSMERRLKKWPDGDTIMLLLQNFKRHLIDFERTAKGTKDSTARHTNSGKEKTLLIEGGAHQEQAVSGRAKSVVGTIDKFKGHKVIQITDDTEGRLGNWTVLKAMEKLLDVLPSNITAAQRICRPGPLHSTVKARGSKRKQCLILGDSISIGYYDLVSAFLEEECDVHHSPWGGDGGSLDTRYMLQCMPLLLSSSFYEPVRYDAIIFNAGLHDVDCCNYSEYVPVKEYFKNLSDIKESLLKTGAQVAFASTTPVPFSRSLNKRVVEYNKAAKRAMKKGKVIKVVDLYKIVTNSCSGRSLRHCVLFQRQPNVHLNEEGYSKIAQEVISEFKRLLKHAKPKQEKMEGDPTKPAKINDSSLPSKYCIRATDGIPQSVRALTGCPVDTTCCINEYSNSFIGCCLLKNAMDCGDNWHCCPAGTVCDPACVGKKCSCRKAPWESMATRLTFSLTMKSLNLFWKKIVKNYPPLLT